jgi:tetratricopeptide (TPR) repeat protein
VQLKVNAEFEEALQLYEGNVRKFPYSLVAKTGRADLLKRLGHYEDALQAYDEIIGISPDYAAARNGKAAILVVRDDFSSALKLLPDHAPVTRDDWVAWHIRGMIFMRLGETDKAIAHFESSRELTPFARERRYFERALSVAQMRKGDFKKAIEALNDVGTLGMSNVLRLHAFAGAGDFGLAKSTYDDLTVHCPSNLVELKNAIASRFGITTLQAPHANDNWIFRRESEALLQEAA